MYCVYRRSTLDAATLCRIISISCSWYGKDCWIFRYRSSYVDDWELDNEGLKRPEDIKISPDLLNHCQGRDSPLKAFPWSRDAINDALKMNHSESSVFKPLIAYSLHDSVLLPISSVSNASQNWKIHGLDRSGWNRTAPAWCRIFAEWKKWNMLDCFWGGKGMWIF